MAEAVDTRALKASEGFARLAPSVVAGYAVAFVWHGQSMDLPGLRPVTAP